jgi:uncharacterized protein (DUF2252 family)
VSAKKPTAKGSSKPAGSGPAGKSAKPAKPAKRSKRSKPSKPAKPTKATTPTTEARTSKPATGKDARNTKDAKRAKGPKPARAKRGRTSNTSTVPVPDDVLATAENIHVAAMLAELQMAKAGPVQRPDRLEAGKALRQSVPRAWHAAWEPGPDRRDPIAILEAQAATRLDELIPIRHGRMVSSPFAFFRGAAAIMAADLATTPTTGIQVQACGDAHLVNFGIFATPERHLVFDVNDFDETLPGPWEWDLKRLGASIAVAARENGCNRIDGDTAVLSAAGAYRERMYELATMRTLDLWYSRVDVDEVLQMIQAMSVEPIGRMAEKTVAKARTRDTLAAVAKLTEVLDGERRIVDHPPLIEHVALANAAEQIRLLYEGYLASLSPELRTLMNRFRLVDVARKVVGVGSVGTRCWIALFEGGADDDPLLLQIKEAQPSVLEQELRTDSIYANHGERVVHGQRMMQAASDLFLGWSTNPATGVHYYWRQLHDMKGSANVPAMSPLQLAGYARICGWALARAHARSGDAAMISGYLGSGDTFDRAIVAFSQDYADQNDRDYQAMVEAVESRRVEATAGI